MLTRPGVLLVAYSICPDSKASGPTGRDLKSSATVARQTGRSGEVRPFSPLRCPVRPTDSRLPPTSGHDGASSGASWSNTLRIKNPTRPVLFHRPPQAVEEALCCPVTMNFHRLRHAHTPVVLSSPFPGYWLRRPRPPGSLCRLKLSRVASPSPEGNPLPIPGG